MDGKKESNPPEKILGLLQSELNPLTKEVRELLGNGDRQIECITWTKAIEDSLDEDELSFPNGTTIFHCSNTSVSDPHHWIEIDIPTQKKITTFIFDDTQQKLIGKWLSMKTPNLWFGYSDQHLSRQQIYLLYEE